MISPSQAPVKPHVVSPETGEAILLEDAVLELLDEMRTGCIQLAGDLGAGKTTALSHLAAVLPVESDVAILDDVPRLEAIHAARSRPVICTSPEPLPEGVQLQLCPWSDDELIEYLLATHPRQCRSVMARLQAADDRNVLRGVPDLCRIALDRMATDETIQHVRGALREEVRQRLPDADAWKLAGKHCLACLLGGSDLDFVSKLKEHGCEDHVLRLLRYRTICLLVAADWIVFALAHRAPHGFLKKRLPRDLIVETGAGLPSEQKSLHHLRKVVKARDTSCHAMAASLLHAADVGWRPIRRPLPVLRGAILTGAAWAEIDLTDAQLQSCDLTIADLHGATLNGCDAVASQFTGSNLRKAKLAGIRAQNAKMAGADLTGVAAYRADFRHANLKRAVLEKADLIMAELQGADLTEAKLRGANLKDAYVSGATIDGADLTGADFTGARLGRLKLNRAQNRGTCFASANLRECDLEYVKLQDARFAHADLEGALLTASTMPYADFREANLKNTGLAEVEWENADLRRADLRGCSFHMGSARSGLVGSPYPSEGSRTGFYTDDYDDQYFKAPEEIRKANLCGARLTGARVDDVDFYLVDLRGAEYDADQAQHFRRCGAILADRTE